MRLAASTSPARAPARAPARRPAAPRLAAFGSIVATVASGGAWFAPFGARGAAWADASTSDAGARPSVATIAGASGAGATAGSASAAGASDGGSKLGLQPIFLSLFEVVDHSSHRPTAAGPGAGATAGDARASGREGAVAAPRKGAAIKLTLELLEQATDLGELSKRLHRRIGPDHRFVVDDLQYPASHDRALPEHRRATFLVDFDQPAVRRVLEAIKSRYGSTPSMSELAAFVDGFITKKDMTRPFDIASVVAERRQGDCTEHAVLLAAVGRAFGYATRVVEGLVLVSTDDAGHAPNGGGRTVAFGHAWVEYHAGQGWAVADAAIPASVEPSYLPMFVIADEGPGYASFGGHGLLAVRRVVIDDR